MAKLHCADPLRLRKKKARGRSDCKSAGGAQIDDQLDVKIKLTNNLTQTKENYVKSVFSIATTHGQAERIVEQLKQKVLRPRNFSTHA
jgi:hypothetical protein